MIQRVLTVTALLAGSVFAQMSSSQRRVDFEQLAGFVAKDYAPYEWKRDAFGFDALKIEGWIDRVESAKSDLEFFEICAEYVASLRDLHSGFYLPSDFLATIGLGVDLYDGKALIDSIDRSELSAFRYRFEIGDELISVDGESAADWIARISRQQSFANERATRRWALDQWFYRDQVVIPRAPEIGDKATVVVKRRSTGALETYEIPWYKTGTPYVVVGPVPSPSTRLAAESVSAPAAFQRSVERVATRRTPTAKRVRSFGSLKPAFTLPAGFITRTGATAGAYIYAGTFTSGPYKIGYVRIPAFPSSYYAQATLLSQLDFEIDYMRNNTDGLVVDVMRNPGGSVCLTDEVLRRFIPYPFRTVGDEFRPNWAIVQQFRQDLWDGIDFGATDTEILLLEAWLNDIETAYYENRGRTGQIPVCGFSLDIQPLTDENGDPWGYDKAMIVLIDEFSTSSADVFPSVIQDANRALMVGQATAGGGGLSMVSGLGFYSETGASMSITLGVRPTPRQAPGLPESAYIENVGARPDIELDIMTEENLLNGGAPFVQGFTRAIVEHIERVRQGNEAISSALPAIPPASPTRARATRQ
ncbi:MAG TPA: S41 family peptidase [Bryobacteraceae bacterium]|mgnify:CR=1 FL=1|nr:S41 family peptidase [Bryobacteraceae bacterium]HPT26275.1 S41 family peptidase [Bryobacteraceae bacterium]